LIFKVLENPKKLKVKILLSWMIIAILFLAGLIVLIFTFFPWGFGAPFQSSSGKAIKNIIELGGIKKDDRVADFGSGTGKLVVELAKTGAEVHGYETNPFLVWLSRKRIEKNNLQKTAFIHRKNFWQADIRNFDIITVFQIKFVMKKLEGKLKKEAVKNMKVISNTWKFPGVTPVKTKSKVYLYVFDQGQNF
jgi:SAM-dependent methyltransferase